MPQENKKKKEDPPINPDDVIKLLKDYGGMLKSQRENLKRKNFAKGGSTKGKARDFARSVNAGILTGLKYNPTMVDKIDNYSYTTKSTPDMKKIIFEVRQKLASGGQVIDDHIAQLEMLIGALEGGAGPVNWLEHDTLQDLKKDLEKALKIGND
jgi:hypothetical protein